MHSSDDTSQIAPHPGEAAGLDPAADDQSGKRLRRRLTPDQQREIARLYAEGGTSTVEIRHQFGIGDSSLYRVLQKHGIALRGRGPLRPRTNTAAERASGAPRRRSPAASGAATSVRLRTSGASSEAGAARDGSGHRFRVEFRAEQVVEARDIRDALRQAESLGATHVWEVTRQ